jgi:hypothetical protein
VALLGAGAVGAAFAWGLRAIGNHSRHLARRCLQQTQEERCRAHDSRLELWVELFVREWAHVHVIFCELHGLHGRLDQNLCTCAQIAFLAACLPHTHQHGTHPHGSQHGEKQTCAAT